MSRRAAVDHVQEARSAPRARATAARSIRSRPACLPICLGEATKLAQYLLADDKAYEADLVLGVETDTLDRTGTVTATRDAAHVTREAIEAALAARTRRAGPGAADVLGDQAGRRAALQRARARRGGRARAAPRSGSIGSSCSTFAIRRALRDRDRVQQGHLRPQPGRGPRHRPRLRRAHDRAAPHARGVFTIAQAARPRPRSTTPRLVADDRGDAAADASIVAAELVPAIRVGRPAAARELVGRRRKSTSDSSWLTRRRAGRGRATSRATRSSTTASSSLDACAAHFPQSPP